jgi:hypothetical protein
MCFVCVLTGVVVARRVVNWYRGISDFEVLLDKRDVQYHTHGGVLRQAAVTVLSGVNHTAVTELKYEALYDKIVSALDKPCYPQLTQGYCVHTGRTTAVLLSEIDNRIRSYRRRVSRQKAAHPGRDSQGTFHSCVIALSSPWFVLRHSDVWEAARAVAVWFCLILKRVANLY